MLNLVKFTYLGRIISEKKTLSLPQCFESVLYVSVLKVNESWGALSVSCFDVLFSH